MRILLLCDRVLSEAADGLVLRVLNLARELASRHTIDLLCLRQATQSVCAPPGLFGRIWSAPQPSARPSAGWLGPFTGWSPESLYVHSPVVEQLLTTEINPSEYDVIWDAGAVLFTQLPATWSGVPVVADLVDDMVLTFRRARRSTPGLINKIRLWKYAHVFGRFERESMRRASRCVVVGDEDAESFRRVSPRVPVSVVANGVDTTYYAPDERTAVPGRIVFEGSMAFPPNEQAALFLVREIMPLVWTARPDATVVLAGRNPSLRLRDLKSERVIVTGAVSDIRDFVLAAEVFACPLLAGAGIKNKLLQAWAMARPVVATSVSVGGLGACDGKNLLIRDGVEPFANAVLELLDDPIRRELLGRAGRQVAVERFAWPAMAERFEALLLCAADEGPVR